MLRLARSSGMTAALFLVATQALAAPPLVRRIEITVDESGMFGGKDTRVTIVPRGDAYRYEGRVKASHASFDDARDTFEGRMKGITWRPEPGEDDADDSEDDNPVAVLLRALRADTVSEDQMLDLAARDTVAATCHKDVRLGDVRLALRKRYHFELADEGETRYTVDVTLPDGTHLKASSSTGFTVPWTVDGRVTWNRDISEALAALMPGDTNDREHLLHRFHDEILGNTAVDDPAAETRLAVLLTRCEGRPSW